MELRLDIQVGDGAKAVYHQVENRDKMGYKKCRRMYNNDK